MLVFPLILFMSLFLVPIVAFEMSYSNENSTIPFMNFNYGKSRGYIYMIRIFSVEIFFSTIIFILSIISNTTKSEQTNLNSSEPDIIFMVSIYILFIIISSFSFAYIFRPIFVFNNLHIPYLNKGVEQNEILYEMVSENEDKNLSKLMNCLFPVSIVCVVMNLSLNSIFHSLFLNSISWGFFSAYGVALTYIISKDVCGEDTKLKEKKSIQIEI